MNEAKAIETLGNIFHFETYTGENGNYELSSNYWNLKFNVRIREFGITIVNDFSTRCSLDTDEDETTIARELLHFIGDVICDASKTYTYEGDSGILAWPYSCNFAYIKTLKQNMDMNPGELEYQYAGRKAGVTNARKPINSSADNDRVYSYSFDYVITHDVPVEQVENIILRNVQGIKEIEVVGNPGINNTSWSKEEYGITSSMQGQERGIQAIMDEYGCSREEAIDIMNSEVTSGCHGKAKKKNKKELSDTEIESSTERNVNNLNKIFG